MIPTTRIEQACERAWATGAPHVALWPLEGGGMAVQPTEERPTAPLLDASLSSYRQWRWCAIGVTGYAATVESESDAEAVAGTLEARYRAGDPTIKESKWILAVDSAGQLYCGAPGGPGDLEAGGGDLAYELVQCLVRSSS